VLWERMLSDRDFSPSRRDLTSLARLNHVFKENRNFQKHLIMNDIPEFNPDTCAISIEKWDMNQLYQTIRAHDKSLTRSENQPIAVIRIDNKNYVVAGNSRINK